MEAPTDSRTFEVSSSFRRLNLVVGSGGLLIAFGGLASFLLEPSSNDAPWALAVFFIMGLCSGYCLSLALRSDRFCVALSPLGISVGSSYRASWEQVERLRQRHVLQRLDLLDESGRRLASIEYQLEDAEKAIQLVLEFWRAPVDRHKRTFQAPLKLSTVITAALLVLLLVGWGFMAVVEDGFYRWVGVFGIVLFLYVEPKEWRTRVRRLEIQEQGLYISFLFRRLHIAWPSIEAVRLRLRHIGKGHKAATITVTQDNDTELEVCPRGLPPFDLYRVLAAHLSDQRAGPA